MKRGAAHLCGRAVATGTSGLRDRRLATLVDTGTVSMGRYSYGTPTVHVYPGDTGRVSVGAFVAIAEDVEIFVGGEHPVSWVSTFPLRARFDLPGALADGIPSTKGDVAIGNDVWIGRGARILSGVTIGDGAVIGAYSLVARDVRPYAIAGGNPAREIRRRFPDDVVASLQQIAWWEWPDEEIRAAVPMLSSDGVEEFLRYASSRTLTTNERPAQ